MRPRQTPASRSPWILLPFALLVLTTGCQITIDSGGGGGDDLTPDTITVRLENDSNADLDPELYVSASDVTAEELFVDANKVTALGVGGLGALVEGQTDEVTFACADAAVIGTRGGRFGEDLNNPAGTGRTIIVRQGESVFCGDVVTVNYREDGAGFTTTFSVTQ